jgi:ABC-2 type transport system ATP-binding protein
MQRYDAQQRSPIISVQNLEKEYPSVRAVNNLSFDVYQGEIFGLLGPNGAGKTTTLGCIEGLIKPDGGQVQVKGHSPATHPQITKRTIGVQLQHTSLLPEMNASEQIQLFAALYGKRFTHADTMQLLDAVALTDKAKALPAAMSGGQQQRLALALALVGDPAVVILDEPTAGLDPQARHKTWELIHDLNREGRTIVLTTHYLEEAETLCGRVGIIDHGSMLALDTPKALVARLNGLARISTITTLDEELVAALPGVDHVWREEKRLHVHTADVSATIGALHDLAAQHSAGVEQLSVHHPNLEEVFLSLTGRQIRESSAA